MKKRGKDGKFIRERNRPWTPATWDDGYIDNRGRFRVYRPDCPRAYALGYALRAHVVWWLENGKCHPEDSDIHHKNGDRLDDRMENLESLSHAQHTRLHCSKGNITLTCEFCGEPFEVTVNKFNSKNREGAPIKYCSQKCYHSMPRSAGHKRAISMGLKRAYEGGIRGTA
jgi:hypothetical protein